MSSRNRALHNTQVSENARTQIIVLDGMLSMSAGGVDSSVLDTSVEQCKAKFSLIFAHPKFAKCVPQGMLGQLADFFQGAKSNTHLSVLIMKIAATLAAPSKVLGWPLVSFGRLAAAK